MEKAIVIEHLKKYYGSQRGIEDVSLIVKKGDIHGFLGPNGAGKTTTLRVLVGLLRPTAGHASIFNKPLSSTQTKSRIGYLPSDYQLYGHLRVEDYLDFVEAIRGSAPLREELIERFNVDVTKKTRELSRGNRQKIGIIQALMHNPELFIADEPTTGLDPLMQEEFMSLIQELHQKGTTIFLSSHILSEVQETCHTVSVIKDGIIISTGIVEDLINQVPRKAIVSFTENVPQEQVHGLFKETHVSITDKQLIIYFKEDEFDIIDKIKSLPNVKKLLLPEPTLEEYFLPMYNR